MKKLFKNPEVSYNNYGTPRQYIKLSSSETNEESPQTISKHKVGTKTNLPLISTKTQRKVSPLASDKKPVLPALKIQRIDRILNLCSKLEDPKLSNMIKKSINMGREISEGVHDWTCNIVEGLKTTRSQAELTRLMNYKKASRNIDTKIMNESKPQVRTELISMTSRVIQFRKSIFLKGNNSTKYLAKRGYF